MRKGENNFLDKKLCKKELLKRVNDLKRRNPNIASQPRANINPKNLLPNPEVKCYIVSREIIERVRKTTDLLASIFGSPEYVRDIFGDRTANHMLLL